MEKSKIQKAEETNKVIEELRALIKVEGEMEKAKEFTLRKKGRRLTWLNKHKAWRDCATHLHNWGDLLEEEDIARSTAYHSMKAFRIYGDSKPLGIFVNRLINLLSIVDEENKWKWIEKAQTIEKTKDWKTELRKAKKLPIPEGCLCPPEAEEEWKMIKCGLCERIKSMKKVGIPKK